MHTFHFRMVKGHYRIFVIGFSLTGLLTLADPLVGIPVLWPQGPPGPGHMVPDDKGLCWYWITHVEDLCLGLTTRECVSVLLVVWKGKRIFDLLQKLPGKDFWALVDFCTYPQVCLQCCFVPVFCGLSHTACVLFGILQLCFRKVRLTVVVICHAANMKALLSQSSQNCKRGGEAQCVN